ncbi:hypothetical protein EV2_014512 [Malus domestica]
MNASLVAPITMEEIKEAAMLMGGLKAPGPDGFQGIFYQSFWENLAGKINGFIEDIWNGNGNSLKINATFVVLIPKVPNPESVSQFRPISLCNYSYKILSKILANRLKPLLPDLISPSQNAFVAGRQIQDNIGIAHELFHFLKSRKAKRKFELGIKLDMHKAYDRVEWDFFMAIMEKMGFAPMWRNLVLGCISTVNFAIMLNGQPGSKFAPTRGLRQGDPLSPYLFLLVSEVLSLLIQKASGTKMINGVQFNPMGPCISHIFFADDTLIFLRADKKNCSNLGSLIQEYCLASGQQVNLQKSSVFFGANLPGALRGELAGILGMPTVETPGCYLGVPTIWGRSKKGGLAYVKDRVLEKVQGWKQSILSSAGKEVLIKAVIQAIPAYPMNIFKFPANFCNELDSIMSNFWWGHKGNKRRIHWVSKNIMGLPKAEGGLGFRSFRDFNDALLAKQCWRLLHDKHSLWARVMKARYFPHCSFLDAKRGGRASWAWSSLLSGRDLLLNESHWQIFNGKGVRVWLDRWLPTLPVGHPLPRGDVQVSRNTLVSMLLSPEKDGWDIDFLKPFISASEFVAIQETQIGDPCLDDRLVWPFDRCGLYTVKSGYHCVHAKREQRVNFGSSSSVTVPGKLWKAIWNLNTPPKLRVFLWKTVHNALATLAGLFRRLVAPSPMCPICKIHEETIEHLFLLCPWVEVIWFGGMLSHRIIRSSISSWVNWLVNITNITLNSKAEMDRVLSYVAFTCWHIWKSRCNFLFQNGSINPRNVLAAIDTSVSAFSEASRNKVIRPSMPNPAAQVPARWCLPPPPFVKINVDASWEQGTISGFSGVVVRDSARTFIAARRGCFASHSAAVAEAIAIRHGCELGVAMGFNLIVIESDSQDSISYLMGKTSNGRWEAFPVLTKCKLIGNSFQDCRWSWIPRLANLAADCLASRRNREMCDFTWVNRPPSSLVHVLCNDGLPCPP